MLSTKDDCGRNPTKTFEDGSLILVWKLLKKYQAPLLGKDNTKEN
jgi:hypothetical protein